MISDTGPTDDKQRRVLGVGLQEATNAVQFASRIGHRDPLGHELKATRPLLSVNGRKAVIVWFQAHCVVRAKAFGQQGRRDGPIRYQRLSSNL